MANITITTTAPQDARIAPAFGKLLSLGRNATVAEVKDAIILFVKNTVFGYERTANAQAFTPEPLDPS